MQWVVYHLSTCRDFTDVVQSAANKGGDSDPIAAITGGLAGLASGFEALPNRYVSAILLSHELDELSLAIVDIRSQS